jgi:hypothetical protein
MGIKDWCAGIHQHSPFPKVAFFYYDPNKYIVIIKNVYWVKQNNDTDLNNSCQKAQDIDEKKEDKKNQHFLSIDISKSS